MRLWCRSAHVHVHKLSAQRPAHHAPMPAALTACQPPSSASSATDSVVHPLRQSDILAFLPLSKPVRCSGAAFVDRYPFWHPLRPQTEFAAPRSNNLITLTWITFTFNVGSFYWVDLSIAILLVFLPKPSASPLEDPRVQAQCMAGVPEAQCMAGAPEASASPHAGAGPVPAGGVY